MRRPSWAVAIAMMLLLVAPSASEACWFGWLCGRQVCHQPCGSCCLSCWFVWPQFHGGSYAPTYRSEWGRASTTIYRPQVTSSVSGETVTNLQPCNTYEWHLRRVRGFSPRHRPIYWSSYNTLYQRPIPTSCRTQSDCRRPAEQTRIESETPYYPRNDARIIPSAPIERRPSEPAERRPQLDPVRWRLPSVPVRPTFRPAPRAVVPVSWPTGVKEPAALAREAWDDTGWESERDW